MLLQYMRLLTTCIVIYLKLLRAGGFLFHAGFPFDTAAKLFDALPVVLLAPRTLLGLGEPAGHARGVLTRLLTRL